MIVLAVIMGSMFLLGTFSMAYQIYKIVVMDAESRGLKHPKFWGFFALGGQNSSGLILYMIGRNRYPLNMAEEVKPIFNSRKRKAILSLCFSAVGIIGLVYLSLSGSLG
ncbi:hypothetical protein [Granulicatella seriolae]|uniref:Uncharacterized protein n=1 Tax=Granulicatella seriolae TaxID=2967226 RepID=A0ABT1WN66_9LACT|nr:hypothetical protein [Granulicatella seriolae]